MSWNCKPWNKKAGNSAHTRFRYMSWRPWNQTLEHVELWINVTGGAEMGAGAEMHKRTKRGWSRLSHVSDAES
jgi:hypothetical protein